MEPTRESFLQQRRRVFGRSNPERLHVDLWEWMIRTGATSYRVRQQLGLPSNLAGIADPNEADPDWGFDRYGMSRTLLPDGRIVCIAGECEDSYDPDFCIYNDVVVLTPPAGSRTVTRDTGKVEIYGYPEAVFPSTDFHSATLVGQHIYVVGRIGYVGTRDPSTTPVLRLDCATFSFATLPCKGEPPSWLHRHHAAYDAARHALTLRGGAIIVPGKGAAVEQRAVYRLHLADARWECTARNERYRQFTLRTKRRCVQTLPDDVFHPRHVPFTPLLLPVCSVDSYTALLDVHGVRVCLDDGGSEVDVLVEGELDPDVVTQLLDDLAANLAEANGTYWNWQETTA